MIDNFQSHHPKRRIPVLTVFSHFLKAADAKVFLPQKMPVYSQSHTCLQADNNTIPNSRTLAAVFSIPYSVHEV